VLCPTLADETVGTEEVKLTIITTSACDDETSPCITAECEVVFQNDVMYIPCGKHTTLQVLEVQPPGKKVMRAKDFHNGLKAAKKRLLTSFPDRLAELGDERL